jgi:phosphatidylinositol alpha-mannosyltransferase
VSSASERLDVNPSRESLRIVLSHTYCWPEVRRGGERYLHELGGALTRAGHRVRIVSTGPEAGRSSVQGVPVTRLRTRALAPGRFGTHAEEVAFGIQVGVWMVPRKVDVWHALGVPDAAAASVLGRVRRFRSVTTALGVPHKWYWDRRPDRRLHELVVNRVDSYVCLSRAAADAVSEGWGRAPDIVGGGVALDRFFPAPARHERPALLYSGTFNERRKNLHLLLEAVAILRTKHTDLELWLSGPGDPSPLIAEAPSAARDATVHLGVGEEDEQARLYGRAWVTVLPSENEAFGLALLESLACGTPIVALADGGGPTDLIEPGVGVASGASAMELADACERAMELAARPDTVDACRAVAARYDWDQAIVPRVEAIYRCRAPSNPTDRSSPVTPAVAAPPVVDRPT